jgi:hypothetical protein
MAIPLWQDIIADLGTAEKQAYSVAMTTTSNVIYTGVAVKMPDAIRIKVRLNDIFADALKEREDPTLDENYVIDEEGAAGATFYVMYGGKTQTYEVVADYSYKWNNDIATEPILNIIDRRMYFVISRLSDKHFYYVLIGDRGIIEEVGSQRMQTLCRGVGEGRDLQIFFADGRELNYEVKDTCADYAIYYINAFGGWDFLVLGGHCSVEDKYTRATMSRVYNNTLYAERGSINTRNDITRTYTLRTSLLNDEQSGKMHHLLGTTRAILYNLNTSEVTPVRLTNSSCDYKTFKGNGNKMSQYTITAEVAQDFERR